MSARKKIVLRVFSSMLQSHLLSYVLAIVIRTKNVDAVKLFFKSNDQNCKNPGLFGRVINEMNEGGTKIPQNVTEFERFSNDFHRAVLDIFKPLLQMKSIRTYAYFNGMDFTRKVICALLTDINNQCETFEWWHGYNGLFEPFVYGFFVSRMVFTK